MGRLYIYTDCSTHLASEHIGTPGSDGQAHETRPTTSLAKDLAKSQLGRTIFTIFDGFNGGLLMFIGVYWILKKLQWIFIGINADLPPKLVE
jgi:hypothetical protein